MDTALVIIVVITLFGLAYPYVIYPFLLTCVPLTRRAAKKEGGDMPSVSVLLSVYNEAEVIGDKIRNFLDLDYPAGLLDLWVVSDGSTDGTDEIVRRFKDNRVRLIAQPRAGKTSALNRAAREAAGEVFVFTDANAMFAPDTIEELTAPFADPAVGVVSGRLVPVGGSGGEGFFYRLQRFLKSRESRLGAIAGADGAIYAMRKALYRTLEPRTINDLFHPIDAAVSGFKSVFAEEALAFEKSDNVMSGEYRRQKRMVSQASMILTAEFPRLVSGGNYRLLWVLLSHKVARWMHFPVLAVLLSALSALGYRHGAGLLYLPWGLYGLFMLAGYLLDRTGARLSFFDMLYKFEVVHIAYVHGLFDRAMGHDYVIWNPRGGVAGK